MMQPNTDLTPIGIIKKSAGLITALGILLIVLGSLALAAPLAAGLSIAIAVGLLLLIGGTGQLLFAFRAGSLAADLLTVVVGGLKAVVGVLMVLHPAVGLISLTALLAAYFVVEGVCEIMWSFQLRPAAGWGWALSSGLASLLLGMMIWAEFPLSGVWAVGLLVGIKMVMSGMTLAFLGAGARAAAKQSPGVP